MIDFFVAPDGSIFRPIRGGDFGTDVTVPGPTPQEISIQEEQLAILRQQQQIVNASIRQQELLAPFLFESAGLIPQIDPDTGEITGFDREVDPLDDLRQEIEQGFLERTQAALAGELPINPALERALEEQGEELNERLRKQLGPGFETSTPGIESLDAFFRSSEELREGARRGDLTLAEQLGLAREGSNQGRIDDFLRRSLGLAGSGLQGAGALSGVFGGFDSVLGNLAAERELQTQGLISSAQNRSATLGALFGAAGNIGGSAVLGSFLKK